ncbi:Hypothetical_protein [Hexamita inflata]|uniref:Hypothetical_protein n=1 Tax=Hexamita inflata TaxID=28002 RepID=A0AA86QA27_9EUKA|nr:Hypothetical protein HINF_LOCUS42831 [Hexamita inflata]CAI9975466.1 Hypothetical protein HINF_LOCUS63111 [Hexamita inflata]CAI9975469.1 Hypothetical protein HINF_LOCUS63114 [Hexamita inflata]CAI9975471.1 Hypothetical protein HINF_LOCUS63116 [Hexamita inflata]
MNSNKVILTIQFQSTRKTVHVPPTYTPVELRSLIYDQFSEVLPFIVTHHMRLLLNGTNILLKAKQSLQTLCKTQHKHLLVIDFVKDQADKRSHLESSILAEMDTAISNLMESEIEVSDIMKEPEFEEEERAEPDITNEISQIRFGFEDFTD